MSHSKAGAASATGSGSLIKGKDNDSPAGTLVECTNGYLMLVKMNNSPAISAVQGFGVALNSLLLAARKSMTLDFKSRILKSPEAGCPSRAKKRFACWTTAHPHVKLQAIVALDLRSRRLPNYREVTQ
jgi:hypothetical protein